MKEEGVNQKDLDRWLKTQEQHRLYLEDDARNELKMFEWKKSKLINTLVSFAFTAGLFLGGFCLIAGVDWMKTTYTKEEIEYFSKVFMLVLGFLAMWFTVWKVTNPLKPHTYYRNPTDD